MNNVRSIRLIALLALSTALLMVQASNGTLHALAESSIIRVTSGGSDSADCGSEAQPCGTIQFAANQLANSGEIRVAAGTYMSSTTGVIQLLNAPDVTVRGGYSTSDWTTSNPTANVTILDGQNARRGVDIRASSIDTCHITVSGFTIVNGAVEVDNPYGGGAYVLSCNATLSDLVVKNSNAIGSTTADADPVKSVGVGGGIAILNANATLNNITLQNNRAQGGNGPSNSPRGGISSGGGLYAFNSSVTGNGIVATGNVTKAGDAPGSAGQLSGQRADALGGGISVINCPSFSFTNITLQGNTAQGGNAGVLGGLGLGGGMNIELSTGTIASADISGNTAVGGISDSSNGTGGSALGGGIFGSAANTTVASVVLNQNTATGGAGTGRGAGGGDGGGGGIYLTNASQPSSLTASNIIVAANTISAGASNNAQNPGGSLGGGVFLMNTTFNVAHATLAANVASGPGTIRGPAIAVLGSDPNSNQGSSGTFANSIIADHRGFSPVYVNVAAGASTFQTDLWSNNVTPNIENSYKRPITEQNPLTGNPRFVAPGSPSFNYHIASNSDAIDKVADTSVSNDIDGQARPFGQASDVGADEYSTVIPLSANAGLDSVALFWQPQGITTVSQVASYEIQYAAAASQVAQQSPVTGIPVTTTSYLLTGIPGNQKYTFTLIARDASGQQVGASNPLTVFVPSTNGGIQILLPIVIK